MTNERQRSVRGGGSLYKRPDGRWQGQISLGHSGGKRVRKTVSGKTATEVQNKLRELKRDADRGVIAAGRSPRLSEYLEQWLETVKRKRTAKTYQAYEFAIRLHIVPDLGRIRLNKLTQHDVNAFLDRKLELTEGETPKLSTATVRHIRSVLRNALNDAMRDDYVVRNVAMLSEPVKVKQYEAVAMSVRDADAFHRAAKGSRYALLYRVALATGMRQSELLGLRWQDVDLEEGFIHVRKQLQRIDGVMTFRDLKTVASRRDIPIPGTLLKALRAHQTEQKADRLKAGGSWQGEKWQLVFTNENGGPVDRTAMYADYQQRLKAAGLEKMRFHDLRHAAATFMAANGMQPKQAQRILGHSNITTTLQIYTHADLDDIRAGLERVSLIFEDVLEVQK